MTEESVKVAVRVRPFNQREIDRKAKLTIHMQGQTTIISNPENPSDEKKFTFDFSYWSHDGFAENKAGILEPSGANSKYASQKKVFDDLGQGVLKNAFEGYNCSLFAYGQTGSGKSYSMVGYGPNKGIVPITCDELFKAIKANADSNKRFQVTFSMLEIYNEQVRDLLTKDIPKGGLTVRQSPAFGFYVEGLKRIPVGSYKEIEQRMDQGTSNRTVAATNMNATSSRAHTVVTIVFDQIIKTDSGENKKSSVLNLVDLAGSERADSTGATGDRLKEGANINRSLSALGNVISALAELSSGKKKIVVPYRDSVLTKLLQNALGGNSKTVMIAALSPADINYDETLSTLRYADRAKKIKNTCTVNESPMDKLIRELREENEKLRLALGHTSTSEMSAEESLRMKMELEALQLRMESLTNSSERGWEEQLEEARKEAAMNVSTETQDSQKERRSKEPHFANMNEDPQLAGVIVYYLDKQLIKIGRETSTEKPDIALKGLSINVKHAVVQRNEKTKEWQISPASSDSKILINGRPLAGTVILKHKNRILFGSNHLYMFYDPQHPVTEPGLPSDIDWDFAQAEIARATGFDTNTKGMSLEQQVIRDQILETVPLVNEVNCISDELNKQRSFEVVLMSGLLLEGSYGNKSTTKMMVKMKNLCNGNTWLWERGKFMNRRFLMQELYQRHLEGEDLSKIKKEDDPFWEPPEEVIIGNANVFLRALSYCLDIDDRLKILDYKGNEEGSIHVKIIPCNQQGRPLGDSADVEDPDDLLNKPYYIKIVINNAEIFKSRFCHGLRVRYRVYQEENTVETPVIKGSLEPKFDHSYMFQIGKVTKEHLKFFENGCITLVMFGVQVDKDIDSRFAKMTTKELRELDQAHENDDRPSRMNFSMGTDEVNKLKSELLAKQKKIDRLEDKERRLQKICQEWSRKPSQEKQFDEFYRSISAVIFSTGSKFRANAEIISTLLKSKQFLSDKKTRPKSSSAVEGSKACSLM